MNRQNPYFVLELPPEATPGEVEREGRKILGLIEVGSSRGACYACPLGPFPRDATMVRDAMAALRDPRKRAVQAALARVLAPPGDAPEGTPFDAPVSEAVRVVYPGL